MRPEILFLASTLLSLWAALVAFGAAFGPAVGQPAPPFTVRDGDDRALTLEALRGQVAVLLYETRDTTEANRPLKRALVKLFDDAPALAGRARVIPVIDCTAASWPFTAIWKGKLKENGAKEGLTIYGDWDGAMLAAYGMKKDSANCFLIDAGGIVRFRAASPLSGPEIDTVLHLLR